MVYIGQAIIVLVVFIALFPDVIASHNPMYMDREAILKPPSLEHWMGTDNYGRDVFSRVIWGTRINLLIGIGGMLIPFISGAILGLLAGYYGGFIDTILMRILDIVLAFPSMLLIISIIAIMGTGIINLLIAIWLVAWRDYARLVRSEVMVAKVSDYVMSARLLGYSNARIIRVHIMPNVINSSISFASADIVMCMIFGASMSFIGLGISPPTPEWGSIIAGGLPFLPKAWWICILPGLVMMVVGIGFSLVADGIADKVRKPRFTDYKKRQNNNE